MPPRRIFLPNEHVYLNGRLVPAARARISVFDRGLLYGDGLFETLRAYRGRPFGLDEHLARLHRSARALRIEIPDLNWASILTRLLRRNELIARDAWVRLMITRGTGEPNLVPAADLTPTVIVLARRVDPSLARAQRDGVGVTLLSFSRESSFAVHKGLNYSSAILGKQIARERGCYEGVYCRSGQLMEGTTSTIFVVRRNTLYTPRVAGILPGVTRRFVIDLAGQSGRRVVEGSVRPPDLRSADEAFLTGSVAEIVPVAQVDGQQVGSGKPGPVTRSLQAAYRSLVRRQ